MRWLESAGAGVVFAAAVLAALLYFATQVYRLVRMQMRVMDTVKRSEAKTDQVKSAIDPANGGIGGKVSTVEQQVKLLRREVKAMRDELGTVTKVLEDHLVESDAVTDEYYEHIREHHQEGET